MPLVYLTFSIFRGARAPANPWGSLGLEWQTPSPPFTKNFVVTPVVTKGPVRLSRTRRHRCLRRSPRTPISSMRTHAIKADTALAGMWLFLASEVLFFGGLIVAWMFCRHWQPSGFNAGARETVLWIGTVNLFLLITSSFVYSTGLAFMEADNPGV